MSVVLMPDKTRLLVTAKDITQNKKFEEQAKLASMGEMIGNIAHQWRQPLSVISTIASGVKLSLEFDTFMKTNVINEMQTIVDQTQYLSKTIDDFRSFIKNSNEGFVLNLNEFLSKTISIVSPRLKNNNISLYLNLNYNALIYGYENELIQAFINIISNARDAILEQNLEDKDKIICIETNKVEQGAQVLIYDSGGGIDAKVIDKIFEPYFTTKHKSIGTGIGLSMARQIIVEHHHASINVQNKTFSMNQKEYQGACFEVIFIEENDGNPERI